MRRIIENLSTFLLWSVWLLGGVLVVKDFYLNTIDAQINALHLQLISWSPLIAAVILIGMWVLIKRSEPLLTGQKKANQTAVHDISWSSEDFLCAQNSKIVDFNFEGSGLQCQVLLNNGESRPATEVNIEVVQASRQSPAKSSFADTQSWLLQKIAARSIILILVLFPQAF